MRIVETTLLGLASMRRLTARAAWTWLILFATSLAGCASITKRAGTDEDAHVLRVERRDKAVEEFEARRDASQYHAAMGRLRCGDIDDAHVMLEAIVKRNPEYLPARLTLAELLLESRQPALALEQVRFVIERAPDEATARHVEGLALESMGRGDEALASFEQAVDLAPQNDVYRLSFQTAADEIARSQAAVETPSPFDVEATLAASALALQRNAAEESVRLLSSAVEQNPGEARLWRSLGASHYRRGAYEEAQVVLTKAVSLDTTDPLSYFLLGATLRRLGRTSESERHLAAAAEIDPRYATWR